MLEKRFCPYCAARLEDRHVEGRVRKYCPECQAPIYENPVPACCCVLTNEAGELLLVQRNVPPGIGDWCLPGGFMEVDETPEETALRELSEETGLTGRIDSLIGITSHPSGLYGSVVINGYRVRRYSGVAKAGDDADDVGFFPFNALPTIAFESHKRFIRIVVATEDP